MIQPKVKARTKTITISLSEDQLTALDAYCKFLGGDTDRSYVVAQALRQVMGRDKRVRKTGAGA